MTDFINIGSTPPDEECAQLGTDGYLKRAKEELHRYVNLIRSSCGQEPPGARLAVKWFQHEFGTYGEVVCHYEEGNEAALSYALHVESHGPADWAGSGAKKWVDPTLS